MAYDPDFLLRSDISLPPVPLPATTRTRQLDYTHFTVLLDPVRRLAAATAVNIDGTQLRDAARNDNWQLDPRIPEAEQAGPALYARNDLDRGHLVRRRDPVWGPTQVAEQANTDTFYYTNAAPQAAGFNQSKELWLGLEDHVLAYAADYQHRLSVFTAPVLDAADPAYRAVAIPLRFWKIAAWVDDRGLGSAGFILDQTSLVDLTQLTNDRLTDGPPPLGPFRTFQVPLADIEQAADVTFGPLIDADRLQVAQGARPGEAWVELGSLEEVQL